MAKRKACTTRTSVNHMASIQEAALIIGSLGSRGVFGFLNGVLLVFDPDGHAQPIPCLATKPDNE